MFSVGDFAIFRGLPVSIKSIDGDEAEIKYYFENSDLIKGFQNKVKLSYLREFNMESAAELLERCNFTIANTNLVIHAINDCLKYI